MTTMMVLSPLSINALHAEAMTAHLKFKDKGGSLLDPNMPTLLKLAALMEEVGEVAEMLTVDKGSDTDPNWQAKFEKELLQVANIAMTWLQSFHREEVLA